MNKKKIAIVIVIIAVALWIFIIFRDDRFGFGSGCGRMVDADGNSYRTVIIGGRCWMAENIKSSVNADGNDIDRYCYEDNVDNCEIYGGLYDWKTADRVCSQGWALPTDDDWSQAEIALGMKEEEASSLGWRESGNVGDKMKSIDDCFVIGSSDCGTGGFEALMAGYRDIDGNYFAIESFGYFWTSSESGPNAWFRYMRLDDSWSYRSTHEKDRALSVRCIKTEEL